ncbi:sporulation related protein [Lutibacter sp. Hel_I_33_5]|uniref:SPOR domain-containing protein n=1 Tax=Lutibacter sp. Hel_I_33_5 TaxID=1566289 RepID=UPI00119D8C99|nr:SPOR domain-containing protein [Lutibacter sp. Hel_I_33_5]TVZ56115.1 sporulation related protein [Lutibacter sp. Hel_I_33_5]
MKLNSKFALLLLIVFIGFSTQKTKAQNNDNEKIKSMISKKRAFNKRYGFGFRIQLYNGAEQRAKRTRARFSVEFPNIKSYLSYDTPEWKIQVGNYKTRLDADRALVEIQPEFSGAIVVPLKVK